MVGAVSVLTHVGITIAACIVIGVFAGRYLDRVLGTSPWLLILFSLLGAAAAFRTIIKTRIVKPQDNKTGSGDTDPQPDTDNKLKSNAAVETELPLGSDAAVETEPPLGSDTLLEADTRSDEGER